LEARSTFATSGKEMHQKAFELPIIANWNPLKNPLRGDFNDELGHVGAVVMPLAALR